jgi:hypothetical protein
VEAEISQWGESTNKTHRIYPKSSHRKIKDSVKQLILPNDVENDIILAITNKHSLATTNKKHGRQEFTSSTTNSGTWLQCWQNSNKISRIRRTKRKL